MKDAITSRLQLFLAKIAGRDVSESTLTPPVITNMEEKLLDEIANRMDAVEEAASSGSGGGGNVVIVDLSELPVEHSVDAIYPLTGESITFGDVFLFDIDPNKYYIFKTAEEIEPGIFGDLYDLSASSSKFTASACEDTSGEQWIEGKTFSDTVDITGFHTLINLPRIFVPTSTQFKTYKKTNSATI